MALELPGNRKRKRTPDGETRIAAQVLPEGVTELGQDARLRYVSGKRHGLEMSKAEFECLEDFMKSNVKRMVTQWGKEKLTWHTSFGEKMHFAGGNRHSGGFDTAPAPIKKIMEAVRSWTKEHHPELFEKFDQLALTCHVNYYAHGGCGLSAHQDVGPTGPIVSLTFLADSQANGRPIEREFRVTEDKVGKKVVARCLLENNSILSMEGADMQRSFYHSVPKTASKKAATLRRINATVRLWGPHTPHHA